MFMESDSFFLIEKEFDSFFLWDKNAKKIKKHINGVNKFYS